MALTKPTFVLTTGGFQGKEMFFQLAAALQVLGYPVRLETFPSMESADAGMHDDTAMVRDKLLMPLLGEGKDVVVMCHSYGGYPISGAIAGLGKKDREAKGLAGSVIGVIYLAAFVPSKGQTMTTPSGRKHPPWAKVDEAKGVIEVTDAKPTLYADVPSPLVDTICAEMRGMSLKVFDEPLLEAGHAAPAFDGRRAYVRCTEDQAAFLEAQDRIIDGSALQWVVRTMHTSHSPFLADPKGLAAVFDEFANIFAAA